MASPAIQPGAGRHQLTYLMSANRSPARPKKSLVPTWKIVSIELLGLRIWSVIILIIRSIIAGVAKADMKAALFFGLLLWIFSRFELL